MSVFVQDVIVAVMALAAAWIIVRRVFGVFQPAKSGPACTNCASGAAACATPAAEAPAASPAQAVPLVIHRRRS